MSMRQRKTGNAKLVIMDSTKQISYNGPSRYSLNPLEMSLFARSPDSRLVLTSNFDHFFFKDKNFLFAHDTTKWKDFVMVFETSDECDQVLAAIKNRKASPPEHETFNEAFFFEFHFFIPILKALRDTTTTRNGFDIDLMKLVQSFETEKKDRFMSLLFNVMGETSQFDFKVVSKIEDDDDDDDVIVLDSDEETPESDADKHSRHVICHSPFRNQTIRYSEPGFRYKQLATSSDYFGHVNDSDEE